MDLWWPKRGEAVPTFLWIPHGQAAFASCTLRNWTPKMQSQRPSGADPSSSPLQTSPLIGCFFFFFVFVNRVMKFFSPLFL